MWPAERVGAGGGEMTVPTALEQLHPRNLKHALVHLQRLVSTHLWAQIVAGMILGIGLSVILGPSEGWWIRARPTCSGSGLRCRVCCVCRSYK